MLMIGRFSTAVVCLCGAPNRRPGWSRVMTDSDELWLQIFRAQMANGRLRLGERDVGKLRMDASPARQNIT